MQARDDQEAVRLRLPGMRAVGGVPWPPPPADLPSWDLPPCAGEDSAEAPAQRWRPFSPQIYQCVVIHSR